MLTRLIHLGWIIGLSVSLAHAQIAATGSPRLVLDADTSITIREGFDAELLYEVPKSQGSIREAVAWTKANRDLNPANAIIIYGWNEHDEGGWLQPTLGLDGRPDETRVRALGRIFRPSLPEKLP